MELRTQKPARAVYRNLPAHSCRNPEQKSAHPEKDSFPISRLEQKVLTFILAAAIGVGSAALAVGADYHLSRPKTKQAISAIGDYVSYVLFGE